MSENECKGLEKKKEIQRGIEKVCVCMCLQERESVRGKTIMTFDKTTTTCHQVENVVVGGHGHCRSGQNGIKVTDIWLSLHWLSNSKTILPDCHPHILFFSPTPFPQLHHCRQHKNMWTHSPNYFQY